VIDYTKILNKNVQGLKSSGIRKFFDIVSESSDAISLGVGEPDFKTPFYVSESAIKSINKGYTKYTQNNGLKELRSEISAYLNKRFSLDYTLDEIIVTVGASESIDLALRAIVSQGDEILIPDPSYVSYFPCVTLSGGVPVAIKTDQTDHFRITKENLEQVITKKTKAIIMPYPNNPTGAVMEKKHLEEILPLIIKHNLIVITDEIYAELTYTKKHFSIASLENMKERTIYINGFSKAFAMTGWRLGYVCAPKEILSAMYKIHQYTIMCAPTMSQYAGIAALKQSEEDNFAIVNTMVDEYDERRRFMLKRFAQMGLTCFEPKGAFYLFPYVGDLGVNGEQFSMLLLQHEKVALVPGNAFGSFGEDYVRISYAYSMKTLVNATDKMESFIKKLKNNQIERE
jgi:aminotransferase